MATTLLCDCHTRIADGNAAVLPGFLTVLYVQFSASWDPNMGSQKICLHMFQFVLLIRVLSRCEIPLKGNFDHLRSDHDVYSLRKAVTDPIVIMDLQKGTRNRASCVTLGNN